ncbi:Uncharacterised protein [Enterobacter cloacae]|nr:Uncharacterised protein [Enterobacter cloacae]
MQDVGAGTAGVARFATLHKAQRFAVLVDHRHGTNVIIIHDRKGVGKRRRAPHRNGWLLVGHVARGDQQQALQRAVLADKRADKLIRRLRQQLIGAGALDNFPLTEYRDTVAELQGFIDIMADQHDGFFQLALHLQELVLDHLAVDRVHRAEGFIHQQYRRIRRQGADDADTLLLPAGHLARIAVEKLVRIHRHHIHQLFGAGFTARFIPAQHARYDGDVLFNGHVREQANLLDHVANVAAQGHGVHAAGVFAVNQDRPAARGDQAVDHLESSGFPAAGRAKQDAHFPFGHVQVDVIDGLKGLAVLL